MSYPEHDLVTLKVFPQDPRHTPDPVTVKVRGGILPGPVGARVAVYDYNRDIDRVFTAARPRKDGSFPDYAPDDLRFHQLNAYAVTARAVELVELELGRSIDWGFEASRLIVLPHAGYLANAFYSEETHSLQLFSFDAGGNTGIYHTSLSHDIVAHEAGHAILDAVRDRYTESAEPETAALHEAIGDISALFAALSHSVIRARVAGKLARVNLVSEIAEDFDGDMQNLRSLRGGAPRNFDGIMQPHTLSLKITRAIYAALRALDSLERRRGKTADYALRLAHRVLQRMVVRAFDYLPPVDATFRDFGSAMLAADYFSNPDDQRAYRATVSAVLVKHDIMTSADVERCQRPARRAWRALPASWPRPTRHEAYRFLDRNRKRLAMRPFPEYRDFVLKHLHVTTRPPLHSEVEQVILCYEYPVDVELPAFNAWVTLHGGGTLVFDTEGRVRHHAEKPVTRARVQQLKDLFNGDAQSNLMAVSKGTADDDIRNHHAQQPWLLTRQGKRAFLRTNPAARCHIGPPAKRGK